jgi:hypothetical protein
MKLHKLHAMLVPAIVAATAACPALAQDASPDGATNLPGPGIFSLAVLGIVAAVGIARRRS